MIVTTLFVLFAGLPQNVQLVLVVCPSVLLLVSLLIATFSPRTLAVVVRSICCILRCSLCRYKQGRRSSARKRAWKSK